MPTELPCGCRVYSPDTDSASDEYDEEEPGWKRLWRKENRSFVPTRASLSAMETVNRFSRVMLVGDAGSGKSAIARHVALEYATKGLVIIPVRTLSDINNSPVKKRSILFIVDDPIGKDVVDENEFRSWHHKKKLLNEYIKNDQSGKRNLMMPKVIVTCRSNLVPNGKGFPFEKYNIVDLDDEKIKMTKIEKEKVLKKHVDCSNIRDVDIESILNTEKAFPSLSRMVSACANFKKDIVSFYSDPFNAIKKEIELLKEVSKERYLCLLLLILHGNQLSVDSFDDHADSCEDQTRNDEEVESGNNVMDNCNDDGVQNDDEGDVYTESTDEEDGDSESEDDEYDIWEDDDGEDSLIDINLLNDLMKTLNISQNTSRKALLNCMKSIRGHYFVKHIERSFKVRYWTKKDNRVFKITNDAFLHVLTVVFCEDIPDKFIKYCESDFFRKMTTSRRSTQYVWSNALLDNRYIDAFLDRVENDVKDGVFLNVFLCTWIRDEMVQKRLKRRLEAKPYEEIIKFAVTSKLNQDVELESFPSAISTKVRGFTRLDLISVCKEASPIVLSLLLNNDDFFQTMFTLVKNGPGGSDYLKKVPLMSACCVNAREDFVRLILENGGRAYECFSECENIYSIHIAANFLQSSILSVILESTNDVNSRTRRKQSPLFLAAAAGNYTLHHSCWNSGNVLCESTNIKDARLKTMLLLVKKGADVDSHPDAFQSPLSLSCATKNMEITELLLQNNANVNEIGHGRKSPLHQAAKSGNIKLLHLLLDKGADTNQKSKRGFTPFYYASLNGHDDIAEVLLSKGTVHELKEETGYSPFFVACQKGRTSLVEKYLRHDPFINVILPTGTSALLGAVDNGHDEIVRLLLDKGAETKIIRHKNNISPLYSAAAHGYDSIVKLLLKHGCEVDCETKGCCTPLIIASQNGHCSVAETLLDNGALVNFASKNNKTPLIYAAEKGHIGVLRLLLQHNANVNHSTKNGDSALTQALLQGHSNVISELLAHGANINQQKIGGETPLYLASENGHVHIVKELLAEKADVHINRKDGCTPLYIASCSGQYEIVKELLIHDEKIDGFESFRPLCIAAYNGHEQIVQILIEKGANVNLQDEDGFTPLIEASKNGWTEVVKILLDVGADTDIYSEEGEDEIEMNALHHASARGHTDVVRLLLDHGMDINAHTEYTEAPLVHALRYERHATSMLLLKRGADINVVIANNSTALYNACNAGFLEVVETLVNHGAEINPKTGPSPLLGAIYKGHTDVVRKLLCQGADANYPVESFDLPTLLLRAVKEQNSVIVQLLLEHGADVNAPNSYLFTPLHVDAYYCRGTDIMSILLKNNADVNAKNHAKQTPLMVTLQGNTATRKRIELLISNGADLSLYDGEQMTALHSAANFNYEMVPVLLQNGANPNIQDKYGDTALHGAAYRGSVAVVNALLNFGANVKIRNKKGLSALDVAIENDHKRVEKIISQKLIDIQNKMKSERDIITVKRLPNDSALPRRRCQSKFKKTWRRP